MSKSKKIKVGVLFGGRSAEHEVSLVSAASVIKHLDKNKYEIIPIGITKAGQWFLGDQAIKMLSSGKELPSKLRASLLPEPNERRLISVNQPRQTLADLDVLFPVLHGTFGEDGTLQGLLEMADLPYVGCGVLGSAVGMDKIIQKLVCLEAGLPSVPFTYFTVYEYKKNQAKCLKDSRKLGYPLFVKPSNSGSSVGISKVKNDQELKNGIKLALKYDNRLLVEKAVPYPLEIECAVLGNDQPKASALGQVISSNEFYDYDAKYVDGQSKLVIPAPLSSRITEVIQSLAVRAFKVLSLSGLARVDFLVSSRSNKVYLNEVNTMPGFTSISMYPKLWQVSGLTYPKLLDRLIKLALDNYRSKKVLQTSYKPVKKWYQ
ncbi:MAG: D-alanine--D-alanine ligase family protein [Patescibacteria group bacterium]